MCDNGHDFDEEYDARVRSSLLQVTVATAQVVEAQAQVEFWQRRLGQLVEAYEDVVMRGPDPF
jgi:hypothetical protein